MQFLHLLQGLCFGAAVIYDVISGPQSRLAAHLGTQYLLDLLRRFFIAL